MLISGVSAVLVSKFDWPGISVSVAGDHSTVAVAPGTSVSEADALRSAVRPTVVMRASLAVSETSSVYVASAVDPGSGRMIEPELQRGPSSSSPENSPPSKTSAEIPAKLAFTSGASSWHPGATSSKLRHECCPFESTQLKSTSPNHPSLRGLYGDRHAYARDRSATASISGREHALAAMTDT